MDNGFFRKAAFVTLCIIFTFAVCLIIKGYYEHKQIEAIERKFGFWSFFGGKTELEKLKINAETQAKIAAEKHKAELEFKENMRKEDSEECRFWRQQAKVDEKTKLRIKEYCGKWD